MRRAYKLTALMVLLGSLFNAAAENPETLKTWTFHGKESSVEIRLSRVIDDERKASTVLEIYSPDRGAPNNGQTSVAEEAVFLAEVLDDMEKLHVDVQSLDLVLLRLSEPDAVARLASYAAASKQWRQAAKSRSPAVYYPVVASMLNESGTYKEWEGVFQKHDLSMKIAGVEKVFLEPFSKAQAKCPSTSCAGILVPFDALVQINIIPRVPVTQTQ